MKRISILTYQNSGYYKEKLKELDMQPGECYMAFNRNHNLSAIWLVIKKEKDIYQVKLVKVQNRGFQRVDWYVTPNNIAVERYIDILQVDRRKFDTLDKQIGMINSQINAYEKLCNVPRI